jgi:hypothetical protein
MAAATRGERLIGIHALRLAARSSGCPFMCECWIIPPGVVRHKEWVAWAARASSGCGRKVLWLACPTLSTLLSLLQRILHALLLHEIGLAWGAALFVFTVVASLAAVTWVIVRLPEDYLVPESRAESSFRHAHPGVKLLAKIGKNFLGVALIVAGAIMAIPGVPGQGLLTLLIGLLLIDFPGKRGLEYRLLARPSVRTKINRIRSRFGRGPLRLRQPGDRHPP